ncbi:MAG: hypothetical protein II107_13225, partial [Prevotella sp.]|nr:hypothetical protein [Prevotella sp.]
TIYCTLMYEGKPAACSSTAIENGYMLLQNVVVSSELRGWIVGALDECVRLGTGAEGFDVQEKRRIA